MKSYRIKQLKFAMTLMVIALAVQTVSATGGTTSSSGDNNEVIRRGYKPSTYRKETGYEEIKFGFIGGEFTRIVKTYDYVPCCRPTQNDIDGCSAPVICPKYDKES